MVPSGARRFRIDSSRAGRRLCLHRLQELPARADRPIVLYLHGATFPSALSVAYRFDGCSWGDAVGDAGFDVWALDFLGFGESDRYPEMDESPDRSAPLGLAREAAHQVDAAVGFIRDYTGQATVSFITHSWGSMPAGLFAAAHPTLVDRIVMFAPIARRTGPRYTPMPDGPGWRIVTAEQQWARFVEDQPPHEPPVLPRELFDAWARAYLATDPQAEGVRTPAGPFVEILRAWHGELAWDPGRVQAPVAILRGAWDGLVSDADASWLFDALVRAPDRRDVKLARGTHLMHLEVTRRALWDESIAFLHGGRRGIQTTNRSEPFRSDRFPTEGAHRMHDQSQKPDLPGYNPGAAEVAKSPITMQELADLRASALLSDEDVVYLRLSHDVLKDQADALVHMWRGIIAQHPHLARSGQDVETGQRDTPYVDRVGRRFAQWVLDTARAEFSQTWLDYQYEIGLRHHRTKKNRTDRAHSDAHVRGRDLIAFAAAIVVPMRPYLAMSGHPADVVGRMYDAWWKAVMLSVTLWSQPYMNPGDF